MPDCGWMATGSVAAFQLPLMVVPKTTELVQVAVAVSVADPPEQMVALDVTGGAGFTVT